MEDEVKTLLRKWGFPEYVLSVFQEHGVNTLEVLKAATPADVSDLPGLTFGDKVLYKKEWIDHFQSPEIRQNHIRRRQMTNYKALERQLQSEFNLDRLEAVAAVASPANRLSVPAPSNVIRSVGKSRGANLALTVSDVERERGRPLSKYDRNMMIFNWLHTLDEPEETATQDEAPEALVVPQTTTASHD